MQRISILAIVLTFFAAPAFCEATLRVVTTDLADEGLNDPTPVGPVGGNQGTTLGEQRRIALQHAADIWGSIIDSPVEIIVHTNFEGLSCSADGAILGSASAATVYNRFPNAPVPETWYPAALASRLSGQDLDEGTPAISAYFNSGLEGDPDCGGGKRWYYGLDENAGPDEYDLVVVALHEFGHGLGFSTQADKGSGRLLGGKPDIYSSFLLDNESGLGWAQMSDEQRAASAVNDGRLVWNGANTTDAAPGVLGPRDLLDVSSPVQLQGTYRVGSASFGPPISVAGITGRVVAALDEVTDDGPTETDACTPLENAAEVAGRIALIDRGECGFAIKVKRAQDAGAIAAIIVNSSEALLTMAGVDASITIPAVSVAMADGAAMRSSLGDGVDVTIRQDPQNFSGADDSHRVQLYAPESLVGGSSVSHWDRAARPDLLMEPSINPSLGHDVDLARNLFEDIGWFASAFTGARMSSFVLIDHDRDGLADPGDTVRIRTTIRNDSNVIGQGVVLETAVPPGLIAQSGPGSELGANDGVVRVELGSLSGGAERMVSFDLTVNPDSPPPAGELLIQGAISGENVLPSTTDDPSTAEENDATALVISHTPLTTTKEVMLLEDRDGSGGLSSLDVLRYLVTITNHSSTPVEEARFDDLIDSNTSLLPGSVVVGSGSVLEGNEAGQSAVRVSLGTIGAGASREIRYDVVIESGIPQGVSSIVNQGTVSAPGYEEQVTDDPSTRELLDATVAAFPRSRSRAVHRHD